MDYIKEIQRLINEALSNLTSTNRENLNIEIEIPGDKSNGDYSTNFILKNFKNLKSGLVDDYANITNPIALSEIIANRISSPVFKRIEAAKPGFINFYIAEDNLAKNTLDSILSDSYFSQPKENNETKVIVEHTSVNPNKSMHIGHLRNAIIGDTVSNIYKRLGYQVEVHNYIDDTGVQVADTTNAIITLNKAQPDDKLFDDYCWDIYSEINALYESNPELKEKQKEILHALEKGEGELYKTSVETVEKIVKLHLQLMNKLGIKYDLLVYESDIIKFGFWKKAFEQLKDSPNFYKESEGKQEGCWVLKYKDEKYGNKIFVRADGTAVYTAKDTAYHMWKFGLLGMDFKYLPLDFGEGSVYRTSFAGQIINRFGHADTIVTAVDERQTYPQEMVRHALETLGYTKQYQNYHHLAYGVVNISADTASALGLKIDETKNSYAMSGRKGVGVKGRDLFELLIKKISAEKMSEHKNEAIAQSIASGALKHFMLKHNPSSEIVFDYNNALQIKGNTGPYLQYSYARAHKLLEKAGEYKKVTSFSHELSQYERELIYKMSQWKNILVEVSDNLVLSYIAEYAYELASTFHLFYENVNIIKEGDREKKFFLLTVIFCYMSVFKDVMNVIGIECVESM